jgi:hypothetical protein
LTWRKPGDLRFQNSLNLLAFELVRRRLMFAGARFGAQHFEWVGGVLVIAAES